MLSDVHRRMPRAVWIVLGAALGLYLTYVLAANVILRTSLLRGWLNTKPDTMHLDYASAWSPYPGRVIVRDFTLRFQDRNVQMLLEIDRAGISIDLAGLTRRTFHVKHLEGEGTSFRLRHKIEKAEGQEGRLAAYPPITGFPDPPVREDPPSDPIPDESYDLWTIHLEGIASTIRELWIMEYRYRGEGSLAGGMRLRPARELWVSPSVLLTRGGVVSIGEKELLAGSIGRVEAQVDPHDVRITPGTAVLRQLSARTEMHGELRDIAALGDTYLRDMPVSLEGGRGRFDANARVDHGLVHPDSRIEWRTDDVIVRSRDIVVRGDLAFTGRVEAKGGAAAALGDPEAQPALVADLALREARASSGKDTLAIARDVTASVSTANNDLTAPFALSAAKVHVRTAQAPDLRALGALVLPEDVRITRGSGAAALRATYRGGALDARADVTVDGLRVDAGTVELAATGKLWAVGASRDASTGIAFSGSGLALDDVALRVKDSRMSGLHVDVDVPEGLARPTSPRAVDGALSLRIVPGDKVLRFAASLASLPKALGEAPSGPDAQARLRVRATEGALDVRVLEARDGALVARGRIRKPKTGEPSGAMLLEVGVLSAGVEIAGGETHVHPFASRAWLEERTR